MLVTIRISIFIALVKIIFPKNLWKGESQERPCYSYFEKVAKRLCHHLGELGRGGLLRVHVPSSNGLKDATPISTSKNENRQAETLTDKHLHVCKCVNMFVYTF